MRQTEDVLRDACARLAEEETLQLEQSLNRKSIQEAEMLFRRHKRQALGLIARNSPKHHSAQTVLRMAACLVLVAGAVWAVFSQGSREPTPLSPGSTASVSPFFTPTPAPTALPTVSPTETPAVTPVPTLSPTESPDLSLNEEISPTQEPMEDVYFTFMPTEAPLFPPTATPAPTETPRAAFCPDGWTGSYFPAVLPDAYQLTDCQTADSSRWAVYEGNGATITFAEYDGQKTVSVPAGVQPAYVQLGDTIALRMETSDGVTMAWEMEGHTLTLTCPAAEIDSVAASVRKIPVS